MWTCEFVYCFALLLHCFDNLLFVVVGDCGFIGSGGDYIVLMLIVTRCLEFAC